MQTCVLICAYKAAVHLVLEFTPTPHVRVPRLFLRVLSAEGLPQVVCVSVVYVCVCVCMHVHMYAHLLNRTTIAQPKTNAEPAVLKV